MNKVTLKYLSGYAEPEAAFAERVTEKYEVCLTIPVLGESPQLFDNLAPALRNIVGKALVVVIVNAREQSTASQKQSNAALISHALELGPNVCIATAPAITLVRTEPADVLLIDRSSPGAWFPEKQGVGLARRIGCDFGLALHAHGTLGSPWLFTSDGDVTLPSDYFAAAAQASPEASTLLYQFWHDASGDSAIDRATADYEAWLRYYVLGLAWAGSPYAYHSLGSTIAIRADAYASVRGFPRRDAAEDFYLLDKLAKVGPLERLRSQRIRIAARTSRRVPFGTGARVSTLVESAEELRFYDPRVFTALQQVLRALNAAALDPDPTTFDRNLEAVPAPLNHPLKAAIDELRMREAITANHESRDPRVRLRRIHTWFDAFRTLKFIHQLEARGLPRVPWPEAARASFLEGLTREAQAEAAAARAELLKMEMSLPNLIGPSLLSTSDR